jgi:hypothetical protein
MKLLAIGGPYDMEFVHDYGWEMIAAVPSKPEMVFQETGDPVAVYDLERVRYRKTKLGFANSVKQIYVADNMSDSEAMNKLKTWLLEQFIQMEDPE